MEDKETLIKHVEQDPAEPEPEDYREEFQCCVCLELLYKPVVLGCGHISCFWCVFNCMNACHESNCPVCRHPYNHFPRICNLLHFILQKLYPKAYHTREKQVGEEEKKAGYFSPQVQNPLAGPDPTESNIPRNVAHSPPCPESKNSKGCSSGASLVNSPEVLDHEANIASFPTSSKNVKPTENAAVQEHCLYGNDLENGTHKEISVSDLLCAACKNLLFQPVVLNCGHVYCESCISIPEDGISRCQICQSMHPNGFPSVCLVLEHFLEEQYPEAYAHRQASSLKQADSRLNVRQRAKRSSSTLSDEYLSCMYGGGPKVHIGIGCDYCGMSPIIGERYRCKDCVERMSFDLCGACYKAPSKISGRFNQQHKPEHKLENVQPEIIDFLTYQSDEDGSEVLEHLGNIPPVPHPQEPENGSNNVQNDSAAFVMSVDTSRDPDDDFNDSLPDLTQE
ncbi:PREDICTED: E3 ubiquitin-protein ligase PRT1-like [Fragaria vesca subsp. vesca]|uniref:E3 ubiquitin-protein ligase PRT1-like n=1 Tax=Fragaria vesca subsp. vesca TaxID=101020 RepID=UPI0002C2DD3B|nr:PREDICTED: E3 ubiquitin-protein ligase PRT1-like [Fragaria vesca subsp. vesca]